MKITFQILNQLDQDERVSFGARALFRALARSQAGAMSWFKMSHAFMGALIKRSRATIKRYLGELEVAGYVVKRGNAAVFNHLKVKLANSYRLCAGINAGLERKEKTPMRWKQVYQRAVTASALWLKGARSESVKDIIQPLSPSFCRQSALEAMLKDRERRRRER